MGSPGFTEQPGMLFVSLTRSRDICFGRLMIRHRQCLSAVKMPSTQLRVEDLGQWLGFSLSSIGAWSIVWSVRRDSRLAAWSFMQMLKRVKPLHSSQPHRNCRGSHQTFRSLCSDGPKLY
ncbi:hypothetical protein BDZ89DRAFT_242952 [Hymenopellis radicata]|nr:hypothetical protein BDZ89DRAFT_242952 [Hymenopellis radicata]